MLSVALGAGANTTVFTLLNAILLRPLPVNDPARLAAVFTLDAHNPGNLLCSYPNYKDYRDRNQVFSSLLLYSAVSVNLTGHGNPQSLVGQIVLATTFRRSVSRWRSAVLSPRKRIRSPAPIRWP